MGPARADGFHPLLTWMTTIGLYDTLTLQPAATDIRMTCDDPSLPCDDRNLVVKAAKLLRGISQHGVAIHLQKNIPHGGGLGGGSSDAASMLTALNLLWNLEKDKQTLSEFAARLGSDIPFFLYGSSSICKGRGEQVRPIPAPTQSKWVLLILPGLSIPTPAVYRHFDAMKLGDHANIETEPAWNHWTALSSMDLLPRLVNDLEAPAFAIEPRLSNLRSEIEKTLDRPVRMSGSGSSLFTLYDHQFEAVSSAAKISNRQGLRAIAVELSPTSH